MQKVFIETKSGEGAAKRLIDTKPILDFTGLHSMQRKCKAISNARYLYSKHCDNCNSQFEGIKTARYCSEACKQKAKRARKNDTVSRRHDTVPQRRE